VLATTLGKRAQLLTLTAAKTVSNTALRWVGIFLPTLEQAFGTTTGTMTSIMGVAELGGLTTSLTGPAFDRGHERTVIAISLAVIGVSSTIALGGSVWTFAIGYALLVLGVGNLTAAGHAWIGHRVAYNVRSRAIGLFETSWALALLIGAPIMAFLIDHFGWRGPYVALLIASSVAAGVVWLLVPKGIPSTAHHAAHNVRLPASAYIPMIASASTAAAGLGLFVVSGAWLDDAHGVSTAGLGLIAALFGGVELVASTGVAALADRIGVRRSVAAGLLVLGAGIVVIANSGDSNPVAVAGLAIFLIGFEYGFVSSLTLVSEAAPQARGKAIGVSNSIGTLARGGAVLLSGQLYEAFGINGSLAMSAGAAALAFVLVMWRPRRRPTP